MLLFLHILIFFFNNVFGFFSAFDSWVNFQTKATTPVDDSLSTEELPQMTCDYQIKPISKFRVSINSDILRNVPWTLQQCQKKIYKHISKKQ